MDAILSNLALGFQNALTVTNLIWVVIGSFLGTLVGTLPAYGRVVLTATPGLTWTISCNGKGATPAEAEKNFAFWTQEIDAIIASFRFLSAKPSPAAVPAAAAKAPATTPDKK